MSSGDWEKNGELDLNLPYKVDLASLLATLNLS